MALFLLPKTALTSLPTAFFEELRPLFPIRQAQYVQVFPLKPAPFCKLSAGLGSTNKSVIYLVFSDSRSALAALSFPRSNFISHSWNIWQELSFPSLLTGYNASSPLVLLGIALSMTGQSGCAAQVIYCIR